jgi:hypothetical protein
MNPMAKSQGLQLARNDKAAAYGCMTAARQGRTPPRVHHRLRGCATEE